MRSVVLYHSPGSLLAIIATAAAVQLPYNPARVIVDGNGTNAYLFKPDPSSFQFSLVALNTSATISSSSSKSLSTISPTLPFLSINKNNAFIPIATENGNISVLAGDCANQAQGLELWRWDPGANDAEEGAWKKLQLSISESNLSVEFLSAGFAFSSTGSADDNGLYVFGGMCPQDASSTVADWTEDATYSNTMLSISPGSSSAQSPYELSVTGQRSPPIAEAGLTITPLMPSYTTGSDGGVSEQQNFVLLGGHTSNAFINMSQVALFSLPEQAWAFLGVDQPAASASADLLVRDSNEVEPRSGHTAVLTADGSRVVVFGGWVGDVNTPAEPQLAILELGQGYGGTGDWAWTIPSQVSSPFASGQGIYGHGAAILPGGVMMISGGHKIAGTSSRLKRDVNNDFLFFNATSSAWIDSYSNPNSPNSPNYVSPSTPPSQVSSNSNSQAKKAGIGFGIGAGVIVIAAILAFWYIYRRRLEKQRTAREKEIRELALGTERYHSSSTIGPGMDGGTRFPELRTASWGNRQEQMIGSSAEFPWAPILSEEQAGRMGMVHEDEPDSNGLRHAERTGLLMEIPSPTRGLRRNMHSRGPTGYGANFGPYPGGAPPVFRIDEEDEHSQSGSLRKSKSPAGEGIKRDSDPFKDPPEQDMPNSRPPTAAEERAKEVQGWVEDWRAAEDTILSRNTSKATSHGRTYSNLSQSHAHSNSGGTNSGRGSPEKSDRTGSNLSEQSMMSSYSIQRSTVGTISRNISQRSASAGYALFAGAAAAMASRVRGGGSSSSSTTNAGPAKPADYGTVPAGISRFPSNRSASLNLHPSTSSHSAITRDPDDTLSTTRTSNNPTVTPGEDQVLLQRPSLRPLTATSEREAYSTPPESPVKKYARVDSFGSRAGRAFGLLGSVKRVFTGTGHVDVRDRVAALEERGSAGSSPIKHSGASGPEMMEIPGGPKRTASAGAGFWGVKQGRRDWEAEYTVNDPDAEIGTKGKKLVRRQRSKTTGSLSKTRAGDTDQSRDAFGPEEMHAVGEDADPEDDWDVEDAVQRRVVQVMFTVPKEKLRVVNADALSLISRSDAGDAGRSETDPAESAEREREVKRMSSVREGDEAEEGLGSAEEERVLVTADDVRVRRVVLADENGDTRGVGREDDGMRDEGKGKGKAKYVFDDD